MSVDTANPAPRPRPFNTLRSLVHAVRSPFSPKSSSRSSRSSRSSPSSTQQINGRAISSPHPDEDTRAIGNRLGVDLNTVQQTSKSRSTPCLPTLPSSPVSFSFSTFVSTSGSSTPFDAASDSSVSVYSHSSSATKLQPRLDYHKLPPSNTPVTETRTPSRPSPPYAPTRPPRAPTSVPLAPQQQQVQLLSHPYSVPPPSPKPPSYSRPTPAAYPDLATPRIRHRSLPSLDRSTATPKPAPPPGTPLPPLPKTAPPPRPRRSAARPSTAGEDSRPRLRAIVSADGDIFTLRQGATAASTTLRPHRARHHASTSTLYF